MDFSSPSPSPPPPLQPRRSQHEPPFTPPVPHRLRRQPKQQALQAQSPAYTRHTNFSQPDNDDLFHTSISVRAVPSHDDDADPQSAAKLPFKQAHDASPQSLLPTLRTVQGSTNGGDPVKITASRARPRFHPYPGRSSGVYTSNTRDASSPAQPDGPVNALPTVLLTPPDPQQASAAALASQYGLVATPPTSSSDPHPSSSPPWITYHHQSSPGSVLASSPPFSGEPQRVRWRDSESDDGDISLPVSISVQDQFLSGRRAPTPHGMQHPYSPRLYETPPSSSSHQGHSDNVASRTGSVAFRLLSSDHTPLSISSIGSAGTVHRDRRYTGHVPAGFFSLFPPRLSPRTPASNRTARSSSDPPRSTRMFAVSPPSSGGSPSPLAGSPRSSVSHMIPVSPLSTGQRGSWAARESVYIDETRSQSETALEYQPEEVRIPVNQYAGQDSLRPPSLLDQISRQAAAAPVARRPVPRRLSEDWHSGRFGPHMSTIVSEDGTISTDPIASSAFAQGSRTPSGDLDLAQMVEQFPQSPTSTHRTSQPITPTQRAQRDSIEGAEEGAYHVGKDLPPLPQKSPHRTRASSITSPQAVYAQDGQPGPSHRNRSSNTSINWFRESIQPWARTYYANESLNRKTMFGRPTSVPAQALFEPPQPLFEPPQLRAPAQARPDSLRMPIERQRELLEQYRQSRGQPLANLPISRYYRPSLIIPQRSKAPEPPSQFSQPSSGNSPQESVGRADPLSSNPPDPATLQRILSRRPKVQSGHRRSLTTPGDWSPHLYHDRRSVVARRRTFIVPSIDESMEGNKPSRRNLQIWLFALGFVFPPAWVIAAFLPLPEGQPDAAAISASRFERDLEKTLGPIDVARHENARWWRRINRCMVPVGLALIVAIVVLVVVAIRFEGARG